MRVFVFALIVLCAGKLSWGQDPFRYFDSNFQERGEPNPKSVWVFGGLHGETNSREFGLFNVTALKLRKRRPGALVIHEMSSGPVLYLVQQQKVPLLYGQPVHRVRPLENMLLNPEWPELFDRPQDYERPARNDRYHLENHRLTWITRSYFMIENIVRAQETDPGAPLVAAMGTGHAVEPSFSLRMRDLGIPVTYIFRRDSIRAEFKVARGLYRLLKHPIEKTRRSLHEDAFDRLKAHAAKVLQDPKYGTENYLDFDVSESEMKVFGKMRQLDAAEVIQKCDDCLCFMDKVGVR